MADTPIDALLAWRNKAAVRTIETRAESLPKEAIDLMLEMSAEINGLKLTVASIEQRVGAIERVEIVHGVNVRGAA